MPDNNGDPLALDATISPRIWAEVHMERLRAHAKHGADSLETVGPFNLHHLAALIDGTAAATRAFCEGPRPDSRLRSELIQVAAMAGAWADALTADVAE